MVRNMDGTKIRELSGGVNQRGLRDHNERLLLSMIHRYGAMPGSDLARMAGLSPQTVSVILRKLTSDGLLQKGQPVRGRVGKPSVPIEIVADGAFAFGLKLGRRSAELILLDFRGNVRDRARIAYDRPQPRQVFQFLNSSIDKITAAAGECAREKICGIGIATPLELWKWDGSSGPDADYFRDWKDVDFVGEIARFSALPVHIVNDGTAACRAEHLYGRGKEFGDYAYFFIGPYIGGGIVLNGGVYEGNQGNAGALGAIRSTGPSGESRQLIDVASLHLLESRLSEGGIDPRVLWDNATDWSSFARYVDPWIGETAQELAKASLSICSVIDFEAVLIDGAFPADVRLELVERTRRYLANQEKRGLIEPKVEPGVVGKLSRAVGAASGPLFAQYMLNSNAAFPAA